MFSFYQNRASTQENAQVMRERDQVSMNTLQEAFGTQEAGTPRQPARAPRVMRPDMTTCPTTLAPPGHTVEHMHFAESCPQGRKRRHSAEAVRPTPPPETYDVPVQGVSVATTGVVG